MDTKLNRMSFRNPRTRRILMSCEPENNDKNETDRLKSKPVYGLKRFGLDTDKKQERFTQQENNDVQESMKTYSTVLEPAQGGQNRNVSVDTNNPYGQLSGGFVDSDNHLSLLQNVVFAGDFENEEINSTNSLESTYQNLCYSLRPKKDRIHIEVSGSDDTDFSPDVSEYLPSPERSNSLFSDHINENFMRSSPASVNISQLYTNNEFVAAPTLLNEVNNTNSTSRQNTEIDRGNPENTKTYLNLVNPEPTVPDPVHLISLPSTSNAQTGASINHNEYSTSTDIATHSMDENILSSIENVTEEFNSSRRTLTRKRKRDVKDWQDVKNKKLKNSGKAYLSVRSKKTHVGKSMGPPCSCKKKCFEKFTQEQRMNIFNQYWKLGDHEKQWQYILRYVKASTIKKMTLSRSRNRTQTLSYTLPINDDLVQVCKVFFLNTLSIGDSLIFTAIEKSKSGGDISDNRGCHENRPRKMKEDTEKSIIEHIGLFPVKESHYVRENTKRLYLHEDVKSIRNMYRLFVFFIEWFKEYQKDNVEVKEGTRRQYETIFNTRFNYSFFKPKKDMCSTCALYEEADPVRKASLEDEYKAHILRKERIRELKRTEKEQTDAQTTTVATFDLEKVLSIPQSNVGVFHYKRKYPIYNFTVHNGKTKTGHCYLWHYQIGKRGAVEIGSCLLCFIQEEKIKDIHNFSFYSDSCPGQNKNRFIFALYMYASKKYNVNITHRFFEVGHSQSEVDSIHSCIERAKQNKIIYTPDQMYSIIMNAKTEGDKYVIKEMQQLDFFDIKQLIVGNNWDRDINNIKIKWSQIKEVHVSSADSGQLMFRYDFDEDYRKLNTQVITRSSRTTNTRQSQRKNATHQENSFENLGAAAIEEVNLKQAYSQPIPISKALYNDLISLCTTEAIPLHYQPFYKSLKCDNYTQDSDSENNEDIM